MPIPSEKAIKNTLEISYRVAPKLAGMDLNRHMNFTPVQRCGYGLIDCISNGSNHTRRRLANHGTYSSFGDCNGDRERLVVSCTMVGDRWGRAGDLSIGRVI